MPWILVIWFLKYASTSPHSHLESGVIHAQPVLLSKNTSGREPSRRASPQGEAQIVHRGRPAGQRPLSVSAPHQEPTWVSSLWPGSPCAVRPCTAGIHDIRELVYEF